MTKIRYHTDGRCHDLSVIGHASGSEAACAGVSAVVYALLGWVENHREELEFIHTGVSSGEVLISCKGGDSAGTAFEMAIIGLAQIAMHSPEQVVIEELSR